MNPTEFKDWPDVPVDQRPKRLFHRGIVGEWELPLRVKGWDPVDVRLLPNATDHDRAEALKAWLEGIRYGTIEADPKQAKWLELESRVYGLHAGKAMGSAVAKAGLDYGDGGDAINLALGFGRDRPWTSTIDEKLTATKRRRGPRVKSKGEEPSDTE